jgi:hypothetical protein
VIIPLPSPTHTWVARDEAWHSGRVEGLLDFVHKIRTVVEDVYDCSVLDVGASCGLLGLTMMFTVSDYVAVDHDIVRCDGPHDILLSNDVCADAHALPFRDRHFDLVVSKQTLPHFRDPLLAIREMQRVARGAVVIRQEFPGGGPIGWVGHSRVQIDSPLDIIGEANPEWHVRYDGTDFVYTRVV